MMTPEQTKELQKPLDPKYVVKPSGDLGPKGDYLEGWHVINEANRIFGFDGWSYTHTLQKVHEGQNSKGNIEIAYICKCTVTVGEVVREDIGYGSGFAKMAGDAHEGAVKEAVTDALKRCLRTFGNPFGLALYDKSRANVSAPPRERITDEQRDELKTLIDSYQYNIGDVCASMGIKTLKEIWQDKFEDAKAFIHKFKPQQEAA